MTDPRVHRIHPGDLALKTPTASGLGVAVVIDVLRATSTIATLLSRGAGEVWTIADPALLEVISPPAGTEMLVVSELKGLPGRFERIDNSPRRVLEMDLQGRLPVVITTNGTRAMAAATPLAERVLLGSFLNLRAVVAALRHARLVTLLPAGSFAAVAEHAEDEACAAAIAASLRGERDDVETRLATCRVDPRILGRLAREPELEGDLDLCLSASNLEVVPEVKIEGRQNDGILKVAAYQGRGH